MAKKINIGMTEADLILIQAAAGLMVDEYRDTERKAETKHDRQAARQLRHQWHIIRSRASGGLQRIVKGGDLMSTIQTEHLGHTITFQEGQGKGYYYAKDTWLCRELGMEAATLGALKTKIAKHEADIRRLGNIQAVRISTRHFGGKVTLEPVTLTVIHENGTQAWGTGKDGRRQLYKLEELAFATERVTRVKIESYNELYADKERLERELDAKLREIPRVTREKLLELKLEQEEKNSDE